MTIKEAFETFVEYNEIMNEALNDLRDAVKKEGSKKIQELINNEEFDSVERINQELKEFTKLSFESNAEEIGEFAKGLFEKDANRMKNKTVSRAKKKLGEINEEKSSFSDVSVITDEQTEERLDLEEKEVQTIKTLGYTSASRIEDAKDDLNESEIKSLSKKGYINTEEIAIGGNKFLSFELNEQGKEKFKELFEIEPNESHRIQLKKKYPSIRKGFFMYDIENGLEERGYEIHDISLNQIEISKDRRHSYLTPDIGDFKVEEYKKILNRKNQLKTIGFICPTKEIMKKAKKATNEWAKGNPAKCKFLTVHFTTLEMIKEEANVFETIKFD